MSEEREKEVLNNCIARLEIILRVAEMEGAKSTIEEINRTIENIKDYNTIIPF